MAIGWRLVTYGGGERVRRGVNSIRAFAVSLGVTFCYSVLGVLCEKSTLSCLAGQWGKTAASIPRGATQTPGYFFI
jgi:hypothetical protein